MRPGDDTIPNSEKFLDRLVGHWLGEGMSDDKEVRDEMQCKWTFARRFLRVNIRQVKGGAYKAVGYFRYDDAQNRVEFYEFSNRGWPVRIMRGAVTKEELRLEEHNGSRHIRIIIKWINGTKFRLTERHIRGKLFVDETFRRKPSEWGVS